MNARTEPPPRLRTFRDIIDALPSHMTGQVIGGRLVVMPRPAPPHINATGALRELLGGPFQRGLGGPGGWDSRLSLARDDTLEVPDVLVLSQAPTIVVLSGCETGLADPLALAGGMSLAQGFVLAGSQRVIASSGTLGDAAAAGLMADLYGAVASGEATDVDMVLTQAQRRATDDGRLYVQSFGH